MLLAGREVRGIRVQPEGNEVDVLAKWFEDDLYIFAANRSDMPSEVEIIVPDGRYVDGVILYGGERRFSVKGSRFRDRFEGYGVRVYRIGKGRV
jgi:hypothetical protein